MNAAELQPTPCEPRTYARGLVRLHTQTVRGLIEALEQLDPDLVCDVQSVSTYTRGKPRLGIWRRDEPQLQIREKL